MTLQSVLDRAHAAHTARRADDCAPVWSTERLLSLALKMLDVAREEQARSNRKNKWLTDNETVETIRFRVATFKPADRGEG